MARMGEATIARLRVAVADPVIAGREKFAGGRVFPLCQINRPNFIGSDKCNRRGSPASRDAGSPGRFAGAYPQTNAPTIRQLSSPIAPMISRADHGPPSPSKPRSARNSPVSPSPIVGATNSVATDRGALSLGVV